MIIEKKLIKDTDKPKKTRDVEVCQFCLKGKGEIPITDGETLQEVLICESCDDSE